MMAAEIQVFTFKDGLLARLAHDLRLTLRRFELRRAGDAISGTFWPGSLVVDGPVGKQGRVDATGLSEGDRRSIAGNLAEVLQVGRFPEVTLSGRVTAGRFTGTLTLVGRTLPIEAAVTTDGVVRAEVVLVPSRWGIAPYRALAGAIKLQDRVVVRVAVPADAPDPCSWTGPERV
jgi:hypothetical protein